MICEILEWLGTFWGGIFSVKGDKIFSSLKVIHYRQIKEYEYGIFIFFSISLKNLVWELDLKECEILLDILISIPLGRPGTLVLVLLLLFTLISIKASLDHSLIILSTILMLMDLLDDIPLPTLIHIK